MMSRRRRHRRWWRRRRLRSCCIHSDFDFRILFFHIIFKYCMADKTMTTEQSGSGDPVQPLQHYKYYI